MIKRYPCQAVILFVLGILAAKGAAQGKGTESSMSGYGLFLLALAAVAALLFVWAWTRREPLRWKKFRQALILLLAFGSGAVRMAVVSDAMQRQLSGILDGQEVSVQGRITKKQLRETSYGTIQWTLCLTDSYLKTSQGIRSCQDLMIYTDLTSGEPVIGTAIFISGKTRLFNEARNDGNFDERAYYQNQGYVLKVYADKDTYQVVDESRDQLREALYYLQQRLVWVYQSGMPEHAAGAMCAMLLGEKSLLLTETKELYRQSGIAHILAISGLHISILGAAVFHMLRRKGVSYPTASAVSMGLLLLFGLMTGMGISTIRAVLMFGIYLGAACCGRAYDSANALAVAAAVILFQNPRSLFLAGFQFSFGAVCGVLLGKEVCQICRPKYRLAETLLISLSIQMLTLPLTAWYYYEIPVYAMLLNLLVLPLMGAVLLLGLSGGLLGLLAPAGMISRGILTGCAWMLGYFSGAGELFLKAPGAVYGIGQPQLWQMAGYYLLLAGCVWRLKKTDWRWKNETVSLSFAICLSLLFFRLPKQAEVVILDVGQGDGIYIHTSDGMDVMIDGGSTDVKQVGTYRMLPFLKANGIAEIDCWFLSHLDQDHISGFLEIAQSGYPIGEVVCSSAVVKDEAYENMMCQLAEWKIKVRYLESGDVLRGKKASFCCISPVLEETLEDRNAKSLVLRYEDGAFSGFFSGDISQKEELKLLSDGQLAHTTLYKAAHHGSRYSNAEELLAQLKPDVSVISCAKDNDYGHPGEEAVRHMQTYSGCTAYTMCAGQIRIRLQKDRLDIQEYRNP